MDLKTAFWMTAIAGGLAACATPAPVGVVITDLTVAETPADVRALAETSAHGFVIGKVQKKVRDGRTYYDVEGELPDGSELEFDILMTEDGPEIVEIQRDLDWATVPEAVQAAAEAAAPGMAPVRVIESTQTDGTVIYELFAPGAPADPAMEVAWSGGVAAVLAERWPH
ncbi:MAG: hypothetical protein Q8L84_10340 [Hyphomonas sp.]|nr:hypothetical protein [Hyphomonas sp.]